MSLVVLSNEQTFNESGQAQTIEAPNRFQNYFTKPIEVPEDSEVAVVSTKINRSGVITIPPQQNFKIYLGTELVSNVTELTDTTSLPIEVDLFQKTGDNNLSIEEFGARVEAALDEDLLHPEFIERTVVSASLNATDDLEGYKFVYSASKNGSENTPLVGSEWVAFNPESDGNASVTASGTFGKVVRGLGAGFTDNVFYETTTPLAPSGGICEFSPSNGSNNTTSWTVGLSRPLNINGVLGEDELELIYPMNFADDTLPADVLGYADFMIQRDAVGDIRLYQTGSNGALVIDEIEYAANASNSSAVGEALFDSASFTKYRFRLENEKMFMEGFDWAAGQYISLCSPIDTTGVPYDQVTKPVSQNEWSLFPMVNFTEANDTMHFSIFNGAYKPGNVPISYLLETYYGRTYVQEGQLDKVELIDNKPFYDINTNMNRTYVGLRGSARNESVDKNVVMILGEELLYTPRYVFPIPNYDIANIFGYDRAIINESDYATLSNNDSVRTFLPTSPPVITPNLREAFIKLDSLTIESFNGATSDISKIIYGVPRFDNSGNATGALYYENADRYYLKLNNTAPLLLNRMDVSLVSIDNKLVQDLFGSTTVTLHFRKSLK